MNEVKKTIKWIKWDVIITSILSILLGIAFIVVPQDSADALCLISGIVLIFAGVIAIASFISYGYFFGGYFFVLGISLILSGIFCLINPWMVKGVLTVIFGIFIIINGSSSIADSIDCARAKVSGWPLMFLMGILTIILGSVVMFGTFDTIMMFAGFSLIFNGIWNIVLTCLFSAKIRKAKKKLREDSTTIYID